MRSHARVRFAVSLAYLLPLAAAAVAADPPARLPSPHGSHQAPPGAAGSPGMSPAPAMHVPVVTAPPRPGPGPPPPPPPPPPPTAPHPALPRRPRATRPAAQPDPGPGYGQGRGRPRPGGPGRALPKPDRRLFRRRDRQRGEGRRAGSVRRSAHRNRREAPAEPEEVRTGGAPVRGPGASPAVPSH
jgi:hypothetical protein